MRDLDSWLAPLEPLAPDLVAPFLALADDGPIAVRRKVRRLAGAGSVGRMLPQHDAIADAFEAHLRSLPDMAFSMPGGEADWTVSEALGHAFESRGRLALAAAFAAAGRWPSDAPVVVPGVPGSADAGRDFAGVHDLMHLEQLAALAFVLGDTPMAGCGRGPAMARASGDSR